jgi:hypothetical protein
MNTASGKGKEERTQKGSRQSLDDRMIPGLLPHSQQSRISPFSYYRAESDSTLLVTQCCLSEGMSSVDDGPEGVLVCSCWGCSGDRVSSSIDSSPRSVIGHKRRSARQ